jgi:hypothetical protein
MKQKLYIIAILSGLLLTAAPDGRAQTLIPGTGLSWELVGGTTLKITGEGTMPDYDWNGQPWNSLMAAISTVDIQTSGPTTIGKNAFYGYWHLTSVTIPDGVTAIGNTAFSECTGLTSVTIPASVTAIGNAAFGRCTGLASVNMAEGLTAIGNEAFYECEGLTSVNIPASVTAIGHSAFRYCTGLTAVTIPASVTTIGNYTFNGCTNLTSVNIPDGVTAIGNSAFAYCTGLTAVDIPDGMTTIGNSAFERCTGLTSVNIPDGVTAIGNSAFAWCTGLTAVDIPDGVTTIGNNAFSNCTGLKEIAMHWMAPTTVAIASNAFSGITMSEVTLYVPPGTEAEYKALSFFAGANVMPHPRPVTVVILSANGGASYPKLVPADTVVTLTLTPSPGYEPEEVLAFKTGDRSTTVALAGTGLARTFVMPAHDVTVEIIYRPTHFEMPSLITTTTLLPDTTGGGVPVKYELDPRSAAYARLDSNRLTPLRDGEIRITATGDLALPLTAYILYISLPPPPFAAIRRTVILPAVSGAVTDPPAGRHAVVSGEDFIFTLAPAPGRLAFPATPVVSTGRTAEPDGIVSDNGDGWSYTVRIPAIRQAVTLRIDIEAPAALDAAAAAALVRSTGSELRITASAPGEAHVYTLAGTLIKTLRYPAGETVATLPAGHYVVVAGGTAYRIIIR